MTEDQTHPNATDRVLVWMGPGVTQMLPYRLMVETNQLTPKITGIKLARPVDGRDKPVDAKVERQRPPKITVIELARPVDGRDSPHVQAQLQEIYAGGVTYYATRAKELASGVRGTLGRRDLPERNFRVGGPNCRSARLVLGLDPQRKAPRS